jgi:hypothetical protein
MILVAGLAIAGLLGIAAYFYFSIRTGGNSRKRNARARAAGSGRTRADAQQGSTAAASDERPANARRAANKDRTANAGRSAVSGRSAASGRSPVATVAMPAYGAGSTPEVSPDDTPGKAWADPGPDDSGRPLGDFGPAAPRPGSRSATRLARTGGTDADEAMAEADEETAGAAKPRRRMGWHKGADMDEEMWPTESFGGVSDDEFWDDLASDKPLARTARAAQPGSANRSLATDPSARSRPGPKAPKPNGAWGNARRTGNSAYPESPPGAGDRTAIQPVHAAPPPSPASPATGSTQPVATQPVATQPVATQPVAAQPAPMAPGQGGSGQGTQYLRTSSQPMRTVPAPSETSGRRLGAGTSADDDPLTSSAYSLRSSGPVDGRSNQAPSGPHDVSRGYYPAAGNRAAEDRADRGRPDRSRPSGGWYRSSDPAAIEAYGRPADAHRGTAPYPYPGQPLSAPVTEVPATPPSGIPYGYGNGSSVPAPAGEPRRPNEPGGPNVTGRPGVTGEHVRRGGGGGYQAPRQGQGEGHPSVGHRRPRDPRDDYQWLVSKR